MSNKPAKKSEIKEDASWRNKTRNRKIMINPEYHLIICEGTKTEPNYFKGLKEEINAKFKNRISLDIVPSGTGRMKALQEAQKIVQKSINHISHVWLVYDKDDFANYEFDNVVYSCSAINAQNRELDDEHSKTEYHALWSNECIEFWFLLHFIDLKSDIHRKDYIKKINEQFKLNGIHREYEKNADDMYQILRKYLFGAIDRAKKIINENLDLSASQIKPGTAVYEIFEKLSSYLK